MRIKELFLQGFKSFASPTHVEFDEGLNVIVGPNGSGKSNLIDAVNWLLANPPKFLRATKNQEVIFQGSSSSSPLGMAFVEISLLDHSQSEFFIGRRVFASSTSEYLVNGQPTKYRDFKDELAKRGIDSSKTKIIALGQEQLQIFFNSSPEARFQLLKGISGVEEWEEKLADLYTRLEAIKTKLQRLNERVKEVEFQIKQIQPLVEEERHYLEKLRELQLIEAIYLKKEIDSKREALKELMHRQKNLLSEKKTLKEEIDLSYQQSAVKEKKMEVVFKRIEKINNLQEKLLTQKEELERELYVYLTQQRGIIATFISTKKELLKIAEEISILEKNFPHFEPIENKENLLEEIKTLQQKLERYLRLLNAVKKRKAKLQEETAVLVNWQKNLESEISNSAKNLRILSEEITKLKTIFREEQENILEQSTQIANLKLRKEKLLKRLSKLKNLEEKIKERLNVFQEKKEIANHIVALAKKLRSKGFTKESIEAISWLLDKLQVLPSTLLSSQNFEKIGKLFLTPNFASCFKEESTSQLPLETLSSDFPVANLVISKGKLIILGGAIAVFPKRMVFQENESNTLTILKKRCQKLQEKKESLEKELQNLEELLAKTEEKSRQHNLHYTKAKEKLKFLLDQKAQQQHFAFQKERHQKEISERLRLKERRALEIRELETKLRSRIDQIKNTLENYNQRLQKADQIYLLKKEYLSKIERLKEKLGLVKKYSNFQLNQTPLTNWHSKNLKFRKVLTLIKKLKTLAEREQQKRNFIEEDLKNLQHKIKSLQQKLQEQEKLYNHLLILKEKIDQEIKDLRTKKVEIDSNEAMSQKIQEFEKYSPEELKNILRKKKQAISSLTPKQGTIEEMERLLEREHWLKTQLAGFEKLISLAQTEMKECYALSVHCFERFMKELQQSFTENFAEIFEGGTARLVLKKDSVETYLKLPGKKERDFILLSSGEKALCSLCFVLALFEATGLSFALLDEADANLDHFNAQKVARLLQKFTQKRQLIVVTHQEEVMEVATRIIGVTMENGVSKIVYLKNIDPETRVDYANLSGRNDQ